MTLCAVKGALGEDEDSILDLISERFLPWAFDLRGASAKRSEVRIYGPSVEEFQMLREGNPATPQTESLDQVIERIIGHSKPVMPATELVRRWVVTSIHIHRLIAAGLLKTVPGTGDAVNKTPSVTRESAIAFLKERQM
jgi:hypothetical protein